MSCVSEDCCRTTSSHASTGEIDVAAKGCSSSVSSRGPGKGTPKLENWSSPSSELGSPIAASELTSEVCCTRFGNFGDISSLVGSAIGVAKPLLVGSAIAMPWHQACSFASSGRPGDGRLIAEEDLMLIGQTSGNPGRRNS